MLTVVIFFYVNFIFCPTKIHQFCNSMSIVFNLIMLSFLKGFPKFFTLKAYRKFFFLNTVWERGANRVLKKFKFFFIVFAII